MASLTIRNLDERVKQNLRIQAAKNGVSMEEEARRTLAERFSSKINAVSHLRITPTAEQKKKAAELMTWIKSLPKGEPLDQRYVKLDQKTVSDMVSDGEL